MPVIPRPLCGTVITAGTMLKAVKVRVTRQVYNQFFKKHFMRRRDYLVSDPTNSTRAGDTVRFAHTRTVSPRIHHTIIDIITPYGEPMHSRPPLQSNERGQAVMKSASTATQP